MRCIALWGMAGNIQEVKQAMNQRTPRTQAKSLMGLQAACRSPANQRKRFLLFGSSQIKSLITFLTDFLYVLIISHLNLNGATPLVYPAKVLSAGFCGRCTNGSLWGTSWPVGGCPRHLCDSVASTSVTHSDTDFENWLYWELTLSLGRAFYLPC